MVKVLITPKSYFEIREEMRPLLQGLEVVFNETGRTLTEEEMADRVADVDGLLVGVDPVTRRVLSAAGRLRAVAKYGVGVDNIDQDALRERGIPLQTTPGANNVSVAELALGLMLALARNLCGAVRSVKDGGWARRQGVELTGKTLGLVGCGQIGREVAVRAGGLGMAVTIADPYFEDEAFLERHGIRRTDMDGLLAGADFVSLHLPLTPETRGIIGRSALERMKPGSFLVNTARGELIDEAALQRALESGGLAGAACDVFTKEPPGDHPLLRLDNFILTPHVGAHTREAVLRMARTATRNLLAMLQAG